MPDTPGLLARTAIQDLLSEGYFDRDQAAEQLAERYPVLFLGSDFYAGGYIDGLIGLGRLTIREHSDHGMYLNWVEPDDHKPGLQQLREGGH